MLIGRSNLLQSVTMRPTGPHGATFTPASLSGLIAWYDASDAATVFKDLGVTQAVNTDLVEQWNDKSGNAYHIGQATSGNRPTLNTTGFSARRAIMFDQTNSQFMDTVQLTSGTQTVAMGTGTTGSLFVVGQMDTATNGFGRLVSYYGNTRTSDNANADSAAWLLRNTTNNEITSFRNAFFALEAISLDTNYRLGSIYDGTNNTIYINNVAGTPVAATPAWSSPGTLSISSANTGGGSYWDGPVAEIVITNTALSSGDRNSLDAYFTAKWGL